MNISKKIEILKLRNLDAGVEKTMKISQQDRKAAIALLDNYGLKAVRMMPGSCTYFISKK